MIKQHINLFKIPSKTQYKLPLSTLIGIIIGVAALLSIFCASLWSSEKIILKKIQICEEEKKQAQITYSLVQEKIKQQLIKNKEQDKTQQLIQDNPLTSEDYHYYFRNNFPIEPLKYMVAQVNQSFMFSSVKLVDDGQLIIAGAASSPELISHFIENIYQQAFFNQAHIEILSLILEKNKWLFSLGVEDK